MRHQVLDQLCDKGDEHFDDGRLDQALAIFDALLALDPKHVRAHINRGGALANIGDSAGALAAYDAALALDPEHVLAHYNRGVVLWDQGEGDRDGALAAFDAAVALDPDYALAHYRRGLVLGAKGDLAVRCGVRCGGGARSKSRRGSFSSRPCAFCAQR